MSKKVEEFKKKEEKLLTELRKDDKLKENTGMRDEYLGLAKLYLSDFSKNLDRTSVELDTQYPLGIDIWKEFLTYPVVRKYIQSFKDEKILIMADKGLMQGETGAVNIKKSISGTAINNSNIVLIRLPEKKDFK